MHSINDIVKTFYLLAKEHKLIRSFKYDRISKGAGIGEENMPELFLEDPIMVGNGTLSGGAVPVLINFDIIMTPQAFENYNTKQLTEVECQSVAYGIAVNMIARLRNMVKYHDEFDNKDYEYLTLRTYNIMTLRNWYDNKAAGVRVTLNMTMQNPINYCDVEEHFDPDKELELDKLLSDIPTDNVGGCVSFDYKLPNFKID